MSVELDPYIEPLDVAGLRESFHNAEPFPFMVIDGFLKEEFYRSILDAYPSAIEAKSIGETFTAVNESGKTQVSDSNTFAEPVAKLNQVLSSPAWLDTLGKITGIDELAADESLDGGGDAHYARRCPSGCARRFQYQSGNQIAPSFEYSGLPQ